MGDVRTRQDRLDTGNEAVMRTAQYCCPIELRARPVHCDLQWQLASPGGGLAAWQGARFSFDALERAFGRAEVCIAVAATMDLRYLYVNEAYRNIRADLTMVGHTYREVFPEAAQAGAEAKLQEVIATGTSWVVEDYPTPLPNRDVPAWWQGECSPLALREAEMDAVLILIWDVTHRHLGEGASIRPGKERSRVNIAKEALRAQMAALGLEEAAGWRISEEIRETPEGTKWILRPLHLRHEGPPLEITVDFVRVPNKNE